MKNIASKKKSKKVKLKEEKEGAETERETRKKVEKERRKSSALQERAARYHLKGNNSVNENNQMNLTVFVWQLAKLKSKKMKKKRLLGFVSRSQRKTSI